MLCSLPNLVYASLLKSFATDALPYQQKPKLCIVDFFFNYLKPAPIFNIE